MPYIEKLYTLFEIFAHSRHREEPMKITSLRIQNFKSIHDMYIPDIENALILVGQNNTGKTLCWTPSEP